jgi:hypothetical protein
VREYGWPLSDIDETNLETLFDFLLMKAPEPDFLIISGRAYKRAVPGKPPAWL